MLSLLEIPCPSVDQAGAVDAPQRVALHSRTHPLITIYTHSSSPTRPPRSLLDPFSLPSPTRASTEQAPFVRAGLAVLPLPSSTRAGKEGGSQEKEESWIVAEVGKDGAVYQRVCSTATDSEEEAGGGGRLVKQWCEEVERVRIGCSGRRKEGSEGGPVGEKEKAETSVLDASKVARALRVGEEVVENGEDREDLGAALEKRVERAVDLMKRAREDDEGGEVGVLTA
jgi:hypothetical protein